MKRALIAVFVGLYSGFTFASPLPDKPHIYVEGRASIEVEPDTVTFSVSLSKSDPVLEVAKADVDNRSAQLIDTLKKIGIQPKDIAATTLRIYPANRWENDKRVSDGTAVSRLVEITVRDLSKYPDVMKTLVDAEISETISTRISISNEKEVTDQALEMAMADAVQRATRIANTQNRKLGKAWSVSEFMTRGSESYMLYPSRGINGQASDAIQAKYARRAPSDPGYEVFVPGVISAEAAIYVVFLMD